MDTDKSVTQALILEVVSDIRLHMRRLVDLTSRSLQVRGAGFEAFSPYELMSQREKVDAARKRHAEIVALGPSGPDRTLQEADARFEWEAAEDVLTAMHAGNHDAQRHGEPYWTRPRVSERAAEFEPGGKEWRQHQERRKNHTHDIRSVGEKLGR